jgi:hypothetical protein
MVAKWHAVQVIGTRVRRILKLLLLACAFRELNIRTTASSSVRTLMLPNGFPP